MSEVMENKIEDLKRRYLDGEFTNYEFTQEINKVLEGRDVKTIKLVPIAGIEKRTHISKAA